jgi:hypothetical protein
MTHEERISSIAGFESIYGKVDELIEGASDEELAFVPDLPDAWSINDFLVHFLDADLSLAFRLRSAIAESGAAVPVWDENAWHDSLAYAAEDGRACLSLAKGLRSFMAVSLRARVEEDWSAFFIEHPSRGKLNLDDLVAMYQEHIVFHLPLIRRNRRAWKDRGAAQ